jgi:dipeptidyl aminopeptidase/acylaminoacyl peptidase
MSRDARLALTVVGLILSVTVGAHVTAKQASNRAITSQTPCVFGRYEDQPAFTKRVYSKGEYDAARTSTAVECRRITYLSDGLKIVGFIVQPVSVGRHYPVIVFNRGGLLDIGKINELNLVDFYDLASQGFLVVASQYRGNDGGEGREEFGGSDVNDVLALRDLAIALPDADAQNVFFYGLSRGGMMTFLALRRGATVNAVAVVGAILDLEDTTAAGKLRTPGIAKTVLNLIPDYATRGASALRDRSAVHWPEEVNVPALIIHGGADEEVPVSEALTFAARLNDLHKSFELVVYASDSHEVTNNRKDRNSRIVSWFRRHMR